MMTRSKNNTPCRLVSAQKSNKENVYRDANLSSFDKTVLGKRQHTEVESPVEVTKKREVKELS